MNVKERIIESALDNFSKRGFSGTTMVKIARDASTSESGVRRFFSQKEDILAEIFLDSWKEINSIISQKSIDTSNPHENLLKFIETIFDFFIRDTRKTKILLRESLPNSEIKEKVKNEFHKFINKFNKIFETGVHKGVFDKNINLEIFRLALYGAIEQILYAFYIKHNKKYKKEDVLRVLNILADTILIKGT